MLHHFTTCSCSANLRQPKWPLSSIATSNTYCHHAGNIAASNCTFFATTCSIWSLPSVQEIPGLRITPACSYIVLYLKVSRNKDLLLRRTAPEGIVVTGVDACLDLSRHMVSVLSALHFVLFQTLWILRSHLSGLLLRRSCPCSFLRITQTRPRTI